MNLISCHILDSTFGKNASKIRVTLRSLNDNEQIFVTNATSDGRIKESFESQENQLFELNIASNDFLKECSNMDFSIIPDIPIKFMTKKQNSHYHFSVVFSPSSYSVISVVSDLDNSI